MITTHVLDTSLGRPAADVGVVLERLDAGQQWRRVGAGTTDDDGRLRDLARADSPVPAGTYRLTFDTGSYFAGREVTGLYPEVTIVFAVDTDGAHYHVPLLLSPYGYSTYRGS